MLVSREFPQFAENGKYHATVAEARGAASDVGDTIDSLATLTLGAYNGDDYLDWGVVLFG